MDNDKNVLATPIAANSIEGKTGWVNPPFCFISNLLSHECLGNAAEQLFVELCPGQQIGLGSAFAIPTYEVVPNRSSPPIITSDRSLIN